LRVLWAALRLAWSLAVSLLALFLNLIIDNFTHNPSLGSMAFTICVIPMVLAPVGYSFSVDNLLISQRWRLGGAVRSLYSVWGRPTVDRVQLGRFLALIS
jgi:hypothetical protein